MKTVWKILLICAGVFALVVAGMLAYMRFITDRIMDKGGMENPNAARYMTNVPAEGAELIDCFLMSNGMSYDDCYSFSLQLQEDKVLFSADYPLEDGERMTFTEKTVESSVLENLRALVLTLDLTQTPEPAYNSDMPLSDGNERRVTLTWDDGTVITPDMGFDEVKGFFVQLLTVMEGG